MDLSAIESVALSVVTDVAKALSSTSAASTSASAVPQTTTAQDGIESLVSVADSLLNSVYPSATLTNLGALTWPSTVVIGSSTYIIHSSSSNTGLATSATSTASSDAESSSLSSTFPVSSKAVAVASSTPTDVSGNSSSGSISGQSHDPWDRRLGIILGVVLGSIALFVFIFLVWFIRRRNKKTGSFFKHRQPSTPSDEEVSSWRTPGATEKYDEGPELVSRPMTAHGMFASRSWTRDNDDLGYRGNELAPAELSAAHDTRRSSTRDVDDRPPTPFSPAAFAALARSPVSPVSPSQQHIWPQTPSELHDTNPFLLRAETSQELEDTQVTRDVHPGHTRPGYDNPFASPEDHDDEAESMLEPPGIPSRSPRRRSSPQVMYPSGEELDKFRFWI